MKKENNMSLKRLTKSSVWEIQENDVFRLWEAAEKDTVRQGYSARRHRLC